MNLTPRLILGDVELTDYPFAVEFGSDLGVAANVVKVIESGLLDGEIQRVSGSSNRTISVPVLLESSDLAGLAEAEALLANECGKDVNEFRIDPGDGYGATTVFTVFRAQFSFQRDDELEQHGFRRYVIEMAALPFGQSEDEVVDVATDYVVTPVTTVMSDGTSTTGWTADDGAVSTSGGVLQVPSHVTDGPSTASRGTVFYGHAAVATYTFAAVDFTSTRFLSADIDLAGCYAFTPSAFADGVALRQVSQGMLPSGLTRFTWAVNDSSVTSLRFSILGTSATTVGGAPVAAVGRIDNVSRSNIGPALSTTGRQALRSVEVTGSARTAASFAVEHETAGLGETLIYTSRELGAGYNPAMRQWLSSAGDAPSADATTVSGFTSTGTHTFEINAAALPPGPYLLMMRGSLGASTNSEVEISVSSVINSTVIRTATAPTDARPAGLSLGVHALGMMTLPLTELPEESTGTVRISLNPTGTFVLDELWAFYMGEDADLTFVKCGTGTPVVGAVHNRLFLDSPTIDNGGAPALYVGTAADRSDAFFPADVPAWGRHPFVPPSVALFVVTTGAAYPKVTLRHRPAWHTHAAS